jgi:hypothetical protein
MTSKASTVVRPQSLGPPSSHIWFDPQCRANDPGLATAIKAFGSYLQAKEIELATRSRARTASARRNFSLAVEAICCNLMIALMVGEETSLAVPLAHGMMWARGRCPNPVYGQHFLDVINLLVSLKLVERLTKGYRFSGKSKAPSLLRSTEGLAEHLPLNDMHWRHIRREPDKELIILKADKDEDGSSAPVDYPTSKRTMLLRAQVARINRWLASADIDALDEAGSLAIGEDGRPIAPFRLSLHRTFNNNSWQEGGRLWGGFWMSMKRAERFRRIRIQGEPIADVDYQQLYPRLAYVRAQAAMPEDDFYDVAGDGSSREGWKTLINAMLFAERPLGNWPHDTRECFPVGTRLKDAVAMIERKHRPIAHLFGSGIGFQLMRIESDILIGVVSHLFKGGIPALPLHDAVLVGRSHAETAKEVMEDELALRTGCRRATVKIDFGPI